MERREHVRRERALDELPALHRDLEVARDDRLRRGGAQRHDHMGLNVFNFFFQPLVACIDLALRRGLVQPPLAAQLPLEVLHRVGDVEVLAIDAGRLERAVEQPAGGADEGQSLLVLLVARLLAHQHHPRVRVAGAEHRLRGVGPQRAVLAARAPPRAVL